jgi:hypothetical protein
LAKTTQIEKPIRYGASLKSLLRGAVAGALEHAEVGAPWANGFAILMGHDPGELVQMSQVMSGPGRQVLGESHWSEGGMAPTAVEIRWLEIQGTELVQAFGAHTRKFI